MAKTKKPAKRAKTTAKKSTTRRAKTTTKRPVAKKTTAVKKSAAVKKTATVKKEAEQKQAIRPGAILFAILLIIIGVVGVILLQESNKLVDEIDESGEANNTIFIPASGDEEADSDDQDQDDQ